MTRLHSLRPGERRQIVNIHGDDAIATRLIEMGLTCGEEIAVTGYAPITHAVECRYRGYRLSIRVTEAKRIEVKTIPAAESTISFPTGETT